MNQSEFSQTGKSPPMIGGSQVRNIDSFVNALCDGARGWAADVEELQCDETERIHRQNMAKCARHVFFLGG